MPRVAAIIVRDGSVALIERRVGTELYYLFPGGAVEDGETPEKACRREAFEELGLVIEVDRLLAEVFFQGKSQHYFLANIVGGTFGTGSGADVRGLTPPEQGTYTPIWMALKEVPRRPVYPRALAELVANTVERGWPALPLKIVDPGRGKS